MAWKAKEVLSISTSYDPEEIDRDRWWFQGQHLLKEPRTSGKAEQVNQEGRWPRAFLATPLVRRNPSHFRERNKLWGVNIKISELWSVLFKALAKEWEVLILEKNLDLLRKDLPQEESQQVGFQLSVPRKVK